MQYNNTSNSLNNDANNDINNDKSNVMDNDINNDTNNDTNNNMNDVDDRSNDTKNDKTDTNMNVEQMQISANLDHLNHHSLQAMGVETDTASKRQSQENGEKSDLKKCKEIANSSWKNAVEKHMSLSEKKNTDDDMRSLETDQENKQPSENKSTKDGVFANVIGKAQTPSEQQSVPEDGEDGINNERNYENIGILPLERDNGLKMNHSESSQCCQQNSAKPNKDGNPKQNSTTEKKSQKNENIKTSSLKTQKRSRNQLSVSYDKQLNHRPVSAQRLRPITSSQCDTEYEIRRADHERPKSGAPRVFL